MKWLRSRKTAPPRLQGTIMHRVSVIVHRSALLLHIHCKNCVSLYYSFRKINHLVQYHLHSSSDVREAMSGTFIQF